MNWVTDGGSAEPITGPDEEPKKPSTTPLEDLGPVDAPVNEEAILAGEKEVAPKLTTEQLIIQMLAVRDERQTIKARDKELIALWRDLEATFLASLDEQGQKRAGTRDGTATITENVLPVIEDYDELVAHIIKSGDVHLLQRRVASAAYREILAAGGSVPGVKTYIQRQVSLRRSTS